MVALSVQIEIAGGLSWPRWKRIVAEVDRLGYRGLYCCDHFYPSGSGYVDAVEIGLAFGYLADHSARLEFGALVSPVSFRDPVWLARDALALDNLSGGRFILGVGAGWMEREHVGFGYELGDRKTRMARLSEALKVIDLLTRREGPVSHSGRFYHLQDAVLLPQSPRPGGPRLMIGGAGPLRTLPLTAKYADIWNVGPRAPEAFRESSDLLSDLLVKAERQPGDVRRTQMIQIICYRGSDLAPRVRHLLAEMPGLDAAAALAAQRARSPHTIVGTPAEVIDRIGAHAAAGVEEIMVQRFDLDDMEGVAIIAEDVLPKV
ncbi:MAG: LLM class flavin-dependent oxidoreductase [Chloroflexi bacterium]|nr:LLM class flavin-dependent oxidoreductase [Chloroflexota bacterium]